MKETVFVTAPLHGREVAVLVLLLAVGLLYGFFSADSAPHERAPEPVMIRVHP